MHCMYADDMMLLSPTLSGLQKMINTCSSFSQSVMRIGQYYKKVCVNLTLNGQNLLFSNKIKYLGIHIKSFRYFLCDFEYVKMKFYRSFNRIYSHCKYSMSEHVSMFLLESYYVPILSYAVEAIKPCIFTQKMLIKRNY